MGYITKGDIIQTLKKAKLRLGADVYSMYQLKLNPPLYPLYHIVSENRD